MTRLKKIFSLVIALNFVFLSLVLAMPAEAEDFFYFRGIGQNLQSDYILSSPKGQVSLKISKSANIEATSIKFMTLTSQAKIGNFFTYPESISPSSDMYFVRFYPKGDALFSDQPQITLTYEPDGYFKNVYYYDWLNLKFTKLEVARDTINKTLTFNIPVGKDSLMFAIFNESEIAGAASWYVHPKYPGELMAASRDFAIGTEVNVTNLYNNKEVIVTIKDYGPKLCADWTEAENIKMGPCRERVLDLSKTAFLQLATSTGQGIISEVKVTPIIK